MLLLPESVRKTMLQQRAQKQLGRKVNAHQISLNPALDLIAVVTSEHQVDIFRFGGQRAFGTRSSRDRASVLNICWRFDGSELAIWWDDNTWQRLDSWTGQAGPILAFFSAYDEPIQSLDHVSWQAKIIDPTSSSYTSFIGTSKTENNQLLRNYPEERTNGSNFAHDSDIADGSHDRVVKLSPEFQTEYLPKLLASFDVTNELPRLSALPQVYDAQLDSNIKQLVSLVSKQELLDKIKDPFKPSSSNTMDLLIVSNNKGYTAFGHGWGHHLGAFELESRSSSLLARASHPLACCEALLTTNRKNDSQGDAHKPSLELRYLSLNALKDSGIYLQLVHQAVNQLSILSNYITLGVVAVRDAWANARDVFSRFIRSIEGSLSETTTPDQPKIDLVTALYRLATTGSCIPAVEEWIVEIMGLKGIDRWYTAYTKGLVQAMNLMHGNILPALDRASIEASRLRSLSRNPHIPMCQLGEKSLDRILDDIDTLRTLTNAALTYARQEIPQIEAFMSFLKCQFQILKEVNSTAAKEAVETFAALDHAQLLAFITGPMTKSHLNVFFGRDTSVIQNALRKPKQFAPKRIILSMLDRHSQHAIQPTTPVVEFVNLLYQSFFLFDSVSEVQKTAVAQFEKDIVVSKAIQLERNGTTFNAVDMHMSFRERKLRSSTDTNTNTSNDNEFSTKIGVVPQRNPSELHLYEIHHESVWPVEETTSSSNVPAESLAQPSTCKTTFAKYEILDVKFANDKVLLVLLHRKDKPPLLIRYSAFAETGFSQSSTSDIRLDDLTGYVIHEFEDEANSTSGGSFVPNHMQVRSSTGGNVLKQVLILDREGSRYKIFDLKDIQET